MTMLRLLVLVLLALAALYALELLLARWRRTPRSPQPRQRPETQTGERLVACRSCGVHVAESRVLGSSTEPFCSEACRRRAMAAS